MSTVSRILTPSRGGGGQSVDGPTESGDASPLRVKNGLSELGPPDLPAQAGPGSSLAFETIALPVQALGAEAKPDIQELCFSPGRPGVGVTVAWEQRQRDR
jgi:hypothetical protein